MDICITLLLLISTVAKYSLAVTNFGECDSPNGEPGVCTNLSECGPLLQLVQKGNYSPQERTYLSKSQCGYVNRQVIICCPNRYINTQTTQPSTTPRPSTNLLPSPPKCGEFVSDRIYGGNVTGREEYPWMALIEYTKTGNAKGHHCGGSLISERYVITAAHCVTGPGIPSDWRLTGVRLGEWDVTTDPDCITQRSGNLDCADRHTDVPVEQTIPHPQYLRNSREQHNDIALLRLGRSVTYSSTIRPVCLPTRPEQRDNTYLNEPMDVAGWGRTEQNVNSNKKLKATVNVVDFEDCKRKYVQQRLTTTQMCAGGVEGIDSCRGDSGGPLVVLERFDNRNTYFLAGVVSFGPTPCGLPGWPGVYTRVAAHIDWIRNSLRS